MENAIEIRVSDTARERVAQTYPQLPADAAETAAGWLTMMEDAESRALAKMKPQESSTAIMALPLREWEIAGIEEGYRLDMAALTKGLTDLLSLYPPPMFAAGWKLVTDF